MDTKHYKTMAYEILSNSEHYELLEKIQAKQTLYLTENWWKHTRTQTEKEEDYLRRYKLKDSNFSGPPKVRKSAQIPSECQQNFTHNMQINNVLSDLTLRPIIAGPACLTHRPSNLIYILLRPF